MGEHKESILVWCLGIQLFVQTVLGGLAASGVIPQASTGGIPSDATLPTGLWSVLTDGIGFWWRCLTFQVPGGGYIASLFFWFIDLVALLMLFLIITSAAGSIF